MPRAAVDPVPTGEAPRRDARERVRRLRASPTTEAATVGDVPGWVPGAPRRAAGPADDVAAGDAGASSAAEPAAVPDDAATVEVVQGGRPDWAKRLVRSGPWGVLAEKWVPETFREARVDPGRRGAVLLLVVAALAAVIAAVGVWWSRPEPAPVPASAVTPLVSPGPTIGTAGSSAAAEPAGPHTAATASGSATLSTTSAAPPGPILVSVTGRVRRPGLVTVPSDSRVADAIAAAGGVLDAADLTGLNLAAHVSDGTSIVVAGPAGSSVQDEVAASGDASGPGAAEPDKVNINSADLQALQRLPGVGPVTAAAIVEYRTQHGPFTDVAQLQEVSGIGPVTFARIEPHATL